MSAIPNSTFKGTANSIGYDVFHPGEETTIQPGETRVIQLDLAMTPPPGSYIRISPRSGLTVKHQLTTMAGVIDPDYTGNIGVVIYNFGNKQQTIKKHQRIAQIIFENASTPRMKKVETLTRTTRGDKGYGSTGLTDMEHNAIASASITPTNDIAIKPEPQYAITLSSDPFDYKTTREVALTGRTQLLGMDITTCPIYNRPKLQKCKPSSPAAKLRNWRSELQGAYILQVGDKQISSINDIKDHIQQAQKSKATTINITFATKIIAENGTK